MSLRLGRGLSIQVLIGTAFFLSSPRPLSAETSLNEITVTSFNIRYYGLNGDHDGEPDSESRDSTIKAHLNRYNLWSDVMVFEEIVDVTGLKNLVGSDYLCRSYENEDQRHQHVVICYRKKFSLAKASDDDNYTLEDVSMGRYRPVVHGILKYRGQPLLHVMGVHLKAQPDCSDIREEQTQMIADYIESRADDQPVIIVGDFNTHNDDSTMMTSIYKKSGVNLKQVNTSQQYTYRVANHGSKLDRIFLSEGVHVVGSPKVSGPCNAVGGSTQSIKTYNKQVSDHCPVTVKIRLDNQF